MFTLFWDNIELIASLLVVLGASILADIFSGIQLNVKENGMKFSWKKLGDGLIRAFMLSTTLILLTVVVSFLPAILDDANIIMVGDDVCNSVSILLIVIILISAIISYFNDALSKVKNILSLKQNNLLNFQYKGIANNTKIVGEKRIVTLPNDLG